MTAAASNAVKFELPGNVSISNVAGGGMPRFLRWRVTARDLLVGAAEPEASSRVLSFFPSMSPPRTLSVWTNKM